MKSLMSSWLLASKVCDNKLLPVKITMQYLSKNELYSKYSLCYNTKVVSLSPYCSPTNQTLITRRKFLIGRV